MLETIAVELNSPVLGLYRSLALLVYTVVGTPDVAPANIGYKLLVVLVSLANDAPDTTVAHEAVVPSVVKYSPAFPVCEGKASTVAHDVAVPLVVRNLPELPV